MNSFTDAFEVPVAVKIGAEELSLRPLTIGDYLPWCAELAQQFRERNLALIPANAKLAERLPIESQIHAKEFTPDDIRPLVFAASSIQRIIQTSVVRATTGKRLNGNASEQAVKDATAKADELIDSLTPKDAEALAMRLSGLYLRDEIEDWYRIPQRAKRKQQEQQADEPPPQSSTFSGPLPNAVGAPSAPTQPTGPSTAS